MTKEKMSWFPMYPEKWLSDARVSAMSYEVQGIYFRLLCHMWVEGGFLPKNEKFLKKLLGLPSTKWTKVWKSSGLYMFFNETDDGQQIYNPSLKEEMEKQLLRSDKARRSVERRWEKRGYERITNVLRTDIRNGYETDTIRDRYRDKDSRETNNSRQGAVKTEDDFSLAPASGKPERKPARPKRPTVEKGESPEDYHLRYLKWADQEMDRVLSLNREIWTAAYPSVDLDQDKRRALAELAKKPSMRISDISKYLGNWIKRTQDWNANKNAGNGRQQYLTKAERVEQVFEAARLAGPDTTKKRWEK